MPRGKVVDPDWMTYADAEPMLGCSHTKIAAMVKAGRIRSRDQTYRAWPSLWRADVDRVAGELAAERAAVQKRRSARPMKAPPDDDHVWLSPAEAALVLGLTRTGVMYRAHEGLLPHVRRGRRVWFRREHIEQAAAARAFVARARGQTPW